MTRKRPAARLALLALLVLAVFFAADADAKYRANGDTSRLSTKFCEQQDALRGLPRSIPLPNDAGTAVRQLVGSVVKIQRSGEHLYVTFDCAPKVGK